MLHFNTNQYVVRFRTEEIKLLPKEFRLLHFLFQHKNQTFSRDQLLDYVWENEGEPTDRTVDDHIYRLRKKLKKWDHFIWIETVRGVGYRLIMNQPRMMPNPSLYNPEIEKHMIHLLSNYLMHGQGEAVRILIENQEALGYRIPHEYFILYKLNQGDIDWLLYDVQIEQMPLEERLYFIVTIYYVVQKQVEKTLYYMDQIFARKLVPKRFPLSLEALRFLSLVEAGDMEKAVKQITAISHRANQENLEKWRIPLSLLEMIPLLISHNKKKLKRQRKKVHHFLKERTKQDLHELALYHLLEGINLLIHQNEHEGKKWINRGWEIAIQSQMLSVKISFLRILLLLCRMCIHCEEIESEYQKKWNDLEKEYQFEEIKKKAEQKIKDYLNQPLSAAENRAV
ncbi:winged helix-turn-helix domain-containing protein [Thermoflavimicrobium dichotomicum]|uniref:Transcriptional regulatory protein, C terminal n=1 Tax=Thermoflavimicrobium dichotomicum TaxID=46223 RepID=A0A1I3SWU5_9BACL|nr:winged helix-turn-helix domain-containing protein [Thermoflavimicrobium dichotomicum]SFJ63235.1 Transcriptional regulatory protein, C terminal [Thermoflavimicrobium dichotomicum]